MPTYDYQCAACGNAFEKFQSITAAPLKKCLACGKSQLRRLIGTGAAVIFKGAGFYQTDYRSESYQKDAKKDQPEKAATGDKPPAGKSADKAADKASGKPSSASTAPAAGTAKPSKRSPANDAA